jgi:sulfate transport system substrate-binding protein
MAPVSPLRRLLLALALGSAALHAQAAEPELLNVSYDVARELYKDVNPAFIAEWKKTSGETVVIKQSHGGSSKQARAVADGLEASVVTMNQANDIDMLADRGLVAKDWAKKFPNNAAPYYSTMVFLVRKGNPKQIRDWADLAKPGVKVVIPNPKTAGNGRYTYLAAWGSVHQERRQRSPGTRSGRPHLQERAGAGRRRPRRHHHLHPAPDRRRPGDLRERSQSGARRIRRRLRSRLPAISVLAESPVAVVDKVVDRKGVRKQATAYLNFLYSETGQSLGAKHYMRVRNEKVMKQFAANYKPIQLFTVDDVFGGWRAAQKRHFDDGGEFDKIYQSK